MCKVGIPFVTGAAVGVSGQAFTILPKESACYYCMFPELNEDTMPTCSIEGVHPSILSIVGGIEVSEAVKIIIGKKPSLSQRILHIDLENLDFTSTRTFRAEECPICGTGKISSVPKQELILEELCGRNRGKRTYSITPTETFDLDVEQVSAIAKKQGFIVENLGDLGLSNLSGGFFGNAANAARNVRSAGWEKAHDNAFAAAVEEAKPHFHRCKRCGHWVDDDCWNEERTLCKDCAPDLQEEYSSIQADAAISDARLKASQVEYVAADKFKQTIIASCPHCGAKVGGGKFCPECGKPLAAEKFCTNCGAKMEAGANFCGECGTKQ